MWDSWEVTCQVSVNFYTSKGGVRCKGIKDISGSSTKIKER